MHKFCLLLLLALVGCVQSADPTLASGRSTLTDEEADGGLRGLVRVEVEDGGTPMYQYCVGDPNNVVCTEPGIPVVTTPCYWGTLGPGDACLVANECAAAADAGPGCYVIGTHGDPNGNVQCLPPGNTVPPGTTNCILSICYGGSNGAAQCVAIQQGLDPSAVRGCTGPVTPSPSGFHCDGIWVDGNGNPLDPCLLSWETGLNMGCNSNDAGYFFAPQ